MSDVSFLFIISYHLPPHTQRERVKEDHCIEQLAAITWKYAGT